MPLIEYGHYVAASSERGTTHTPIMHVRTLLWLPKAGRKAAAAALEGVNDMVGGASLWWRRWSLNIYTQKYDGGRERLNLYRLQRGDFRL